MSQSQQSEKDKKAREALEAWVKNYNSWCHDAKETGWQSREK